MGEGSTTEAPTIFERATVIIDAGKDRASEQGQLQMGCRFIEAVLVISMMNRITVVVTNNTNLAIEWQQRFILLRTMIVHHEKRYY
mmetsp:Transcript_26757/g.75025  ORF Transcript_26757/g.75025 Transcript_26757/m.75025 type:complete len:86 (+) Transcript_26757:1880-2137(+)